MLNLNQAQNACANSGNGGAAWRPADLPAMFDVARGTGVYNEVIIDARHWTRNLPHSVEAIFSTAGGEVEAGRIHAGLVEAYRLDAGAVPLLALDSRDWNAPFRRVSAAVDGAPAPVARAKEDGWHHSLGTGNGPLHRAHGIF